MVQVWCPHSAQGHYVIPMGYALTLRPVYFTKFSPMSHQTPFLPCSGHLEISFDKNWRFLQALQPILSIYRDGGAGWVGGYLLNQFLDK